MLVEMSDEGTNSVLSQNLSLMCFIMKFKISHRMVTNGKQYLIKAMIWGGREAA